MKFFSYSLMFLLMIENYHFQTYIDESAKISQPNGTQASPYPSLAFAFSKISSNFLIFIAKSDFSIPSVNLISMSFSLRFFLLYILIIILSRGENFAQRAWLLENSSVIMKNCSISLQNLSFSSNSTNFFSPFFILEKSVLEISVKNIKYEFC